MHHILVFSRSAVVLRHWFEIDLGDASMEHGARIELRERAPQPHRGSESAAQVIAADRPLWRADLFDRLTDQPGTYGVAHYHPEFAGNEPCARTWDPELTASPWRWLHDQFAKPGSGPLSAARQLEPTDAGELSGLADVIVTLAQQFAPDRCRSREDCYRLTRDMRESVQLMIEYQRRPELLDAERVAPWRVPA